MSKKKLSTLVLSLLILVSFLAGCTLTPEGTALMNAFKKSQDIQSMETFEQVKFNLSVEGASSKEQEAVTEFQELINSAVVSGYSKFYTQGDFYRAYVKSSVNIGAPMTTDVWVVQNPQAKISRQYIKSPFTFSTQYPKYQDRYFYVDNELIKKRPELKQYSGIDLASQIQGSRDLQKNMFEFITKYGDNFDPGFTFISDLGTSTVSINKQNINAHLYQMKFNDAQFKTLIRKIVNEFGNKPEAMQFVKDYLISSLTTSGVAGSDLNAIKAEIDTTFSELTSTEFNTEFNKFMDSIANVQLLGPKGIEITFAINDAGYIVKQTGDYELFIDLNQLNTVLTDMGDTTITDEGLTGKYTLGIHSEASYDKINEKVAILFPVLNERNSFTPAKLYHDNLPKGLSVVVNKKKSTVVSNKVYFIKVRDITTPLKADYTYSKGNVTLKVNGKTIIFKKGTNFVKINGKTYKLKTVNSKLINDRLYISQDVLKLVGVSVSIK